MIGDQYADLAPLQVADNVLDVVDRDRIDPGEGFIEQYEFGFGGQGARDFHPPAFAAGQGHARGVANMGDVKFLKQFFQHGLALFAGQFAARLQNGHDVVGHRQLAKNGRFLRQVPQAVAGATVDALAGDVAVINGNAPVIRVDDADNHVKTGGFTRTVRAEQANNLAAANLQRDIPDYLAAFVGFGEVFGFEQRHISGLNPVVAVRPRRRPYPGAAGAC